MLFTLSLKHYFTKKGLLFEKLLNVVFFSGGIIRFGKLVEGSKVHIYRDVCLNKNYRLVNN